MIYLLCDILVRSLSENLNFISYYFSYNISVLFVLYFISSVPLFLQDQNDIHILINEEEAMEINETVHHKIRPDLNMPLCDEVSTTKFEVLLMILHFMLRHGITDVAIKDFLKLINSIFKYGCNYCIHPDNSLTYTVTRIENATNIKIYEVEDRTNDGIRKDMLQAEQTGIEVRGVKGVSPVAVISEFNLVHGFVLDYMHCVLLGVIRLVTGLWLDSTSHNEKYYIGLKRHEIDNRLLAIRPPSSFPRLPRSLKERSFWKANEWRTWLLYYSLPCLKNILPLKYYKHHCLLVSAIYTFLRNKISISDIDNTTWNLVQYVIHFQKLYGPQNMTFNVHLLLHLDRTVLMFGPLWCYSAFSWESGNGFLLKFVKGTRGVLTQIARKYTYLQSLSRLLGQYNIADSTINYCVQ
ncbi:hypothetical protein ALC60_07166 [Trachymyrmex zeteki]|uniref:Uncharacterized protein n=1 Tax=Mycetomoellerius zeteki TaxID=64791 RepID=A0A151X101_9HYME|nr:hypothetical protein ALC60_07166 [Trachymyrmex zeteki]